MEGHTLEVEIGSLPKKNLVTDATIGYFLSSTGQNSKIHETFSKSHSPSTLLR